MNEPWFVKIAPRQGKYNIALDKILWLGQITLKEAPFDHFPMEQIKLPPVNLCFALDAQTTVFLCKQPSKQVKLPKDI